MRDRKPNRLRGYDYSQGGYYFITVCAQGRCCRFGKIENGEMILNDAGKMAYKLWEAMPFHYPGVQIDAFVVMPNHLHGIIIIGAPGVGTGPCACPETIGGGRPQGAAPTSRDNPQWLSEKRLSLSDLILRYKSLTTRKYIDGVARDDWPLFNQRLWQRSFYDHVIRDEYTLQRIREYIVNNPLSWELDIENPGNLGKDARAYYDEIIKAGTKKEARPGGLNVPGCAGMQQFRNKSTLIDDNSG